MSKKNEKGKQKGAFDFMETPFFRRFMSVAYGLGASIVILGALFKINHYPLATEMLLVGMITEAIIFALSAFQKPHVEPDWSKVYPEFLEDYHGIKPDEALLQKQPVRSGAGPMTQLDIMLKDVNLDDNVIHRLGTGLTKLSESASKLNDLTNASLATQDFVSNMKTASQSVSSLSKTYTDASMAMTKEVAATSELTSKVQDMSNAASGLKNAYIEAARTFKDDIRASEDLSQTIKNASDSAAKLSETYFHSAENIAKTIEDLKSSAGKSEDFNLQLSKLSDNLASLNRIYELQLSNSELQTQASAKLEQTLEKFLSNLEESSNKTIQYQRELDTLTKRMASLNSVYGNMLSAMNIK
ncbi:MAG TPA: gliding motility protein GldL [Bacteroidales bacterium]|nr:gliding motility protein GldL [Bacteroidales bacterium]HPR58154.1 gliding motility protein GldL [Bacteroidales bacterium]